MRFALLPRSLRPRPTACLARTETLENRLMMHNGEHHGEVHHHDDGGMTHGHESHESQEHESHDHPEWTVPDFIRVDPNASIASVDEPAPPPAPVTTILNNGPTANRVDLVIVGDGYTSAQLSTYAGHAANVATNFFNEVPLSTYAGLFNIHRVDVVSAQSGVDNDPTVGVLKTTALDMHFNCNGTDRLLCVDTTKAQSYAVNAPQVDQVLALANSTKYGGAGYWGAGVLTASGGNGSSLEVVRHEFGHSFAGLADEYGGAGTYTGAEPNEPNVSIRTAAQLASLQQKWYRWLDLPSVDTFQGGYYKDFGVYRPTNDSKMRSLGQPWGPVNTEQLIFALYRKIRPIDSATPAGAYAADADFSVNPIDPRGHSMAVQWLVNNVPVPGATGLTFDAGSLNLPVGNHTLTVRVTDPTPMVRNEPMRAQLMTQTRSWTLVQTATSTVEGRYVFYNNSAFDNHGAGADPFDDLAVAADKAALLDGTVLAAAEAGVALPGAFANYTNYTKGLNGLMVDLRGTASALTAADFSFRAGAGGDPAGWAPVTGAVVDYRPGDGAGGSDRYTVVLPDGAVRNQWLQVTVKKTAASALPADDVFYFGNLAGDTGTGTGTSINGLDVVATRSNLSREAGLDSRYDHNRDGRADLFDLVFTRRNLFSNLQPIGGPTIATAPTAVAPPPEDDGTPVLTALLLTSVHPLLDRAGKSLLA